MGKNIDTDLLARYTKGKYSYNDLKRIREWFASPNSGKTLSNSLYSHWESILKNNTDSKNLQHIYKNIHYEILVSESNKKNSRGIFNNLRKIAAILIIAIFFSGMGFYFAKYQKTDHPGWIEINAPLGSRVEFLLPDSTRGWLNSGSKLKYSSNFMANRLVDLTGEGYFDVKHLDNSGFRVSVPDMNIDVLGTKFNVTAYSEDDFTEVVLEKGKVEISGKTGNYNQILKPNEKISFNRRDRKIRLNEVNPLRSSAWKEGMLVIENESLGKALHRIERWYNIRVIIKDDEISDYHFKATFIDEPLEEVLRLIAKTTPIDYEIEDRKFSDKSVIEKRNVIIKKK